MFAKYGVQMLNSCMGTSATEKGHILGAKPQIIVGWSSDSKFIEKSMPSYLESIVRQVLSAKFDSTEEGEVQVSAKAYLNLLSSGRNARSRNNWKIFKALPAVQSFFPHVAQFYWNTTLLWSCLGQQGTFLVLYR